MGGRKGHLSCNPAGVEAVFLLDEEQRGKSKAERNRFNKRERERWSSYRSLTCAACGEDTHHHSECRFNQANRQQRPMVGGREAQQRYNTPSSNQDRFSFDGR